jgi:site-specific recombinase XerD
MARRRRLPNVLHAAERQQFLTAAAAEVERAPSPAKRLAAVRDRLLVQIGLTMGLRVSELIGLDIEHLDFEGRNCLVAHGKGDKDRYVPIPSAVVAALKSWIGDRTAGPVFLQPNGKRLAKRTVQLRVKRIAKRAGIARNVKCHTLRHTFATRLVDTGADVRLVQELMGHASLNTTEVYLHVSTERMRGAVDRAADESP